MKLSELQPEWVNYVEKGSFIRFSDTHSHVNYDVDEVAEGFHSQSEDLAHSDGVLFLCPTCFIKNGGTVGTESVLCWFAGRPHIPDDALPGPCRWWVSGTSFDDITLSPSVNVDKEHWHGSIKNGEVT